MSEDVSQAAWTDAIDDLRARVIAAADKFDPKKAAQPATDAVFQEASILGWQFKARATEVVGAQGGGRLWSLLGTRSDEPDDRVRFMTRDLLVRLGASEEFSKPVARGRDEKTGDVAWSWGWMEAIRTPPKPKVVVVGRNEPCSCGSKAKFKKCCGKVVS